MCELKKKRYQKHNYYFFKGIELYESTYLQVRLYKSMHKSRSIKKWIAKMLYKEDYINTTWTTFEHKVKFWSEDLGKLGKE